MSRRSLLPAMATLINLAGGALSMPGHYNTEGAGRYSWRRNSFMAARRMGRRRAARNRRKAARS